MKSRVQSGSSSHGFAGRMKTDAGKGLSNIESKRAWGGPAGLDRGAIEAYFGQAHAPWIPDTRGGTPADRESQARNTIRSSGSLT